MPFTYLLTQGQPMGTVLLVDDDKLLLDSASQVLSYLHYNVIQANDGQEAVELYKEYRDTITFVLMDIQMPRMDGMIATLHIREFDPEAKVILTSGQSFYDPYMVNPNAFIPKPYRLQELKLAIDKALT